MYELPRCHPIPKEDLLNFSEYILGLLDHADDRHNTEDRRDKQLLASERGEVQGPGIHQLVSEMM